MSTQRLIRLTTWAAIVFGDDVPSKRTLYRMVEQGKIYPPPQKYGGKTYFVSPDAKLIDPHKGPKHATTQQIKSRLAA